MKASTSTNHLRRYHNALDEENDVIRKFHSELRWNVGDGEDFPAPIVEVPSMEASATQTADSPDNKKLRAVNVRMLDGENFETHWNVLVPPFPGPPDHELRSPIDAAVVRQA